MSHSAGPSLGRLVRTNALAYLVSSSVTSQSRFFSLIPERGRQDDGEASVGRRVGVGVGADQPQPEHVVGAVAPQASIHVIRSYYMCGIQAPVL
jgi:hypothetical protein